MFLLSSILRYKKTTPTNQGFGLVELLVSISIMVIIASVVLVRQSSFNGAVLLRSQAYEVALQIRDAQLNAVSATGQAGNFRSLIGVHFDTANSATYRVFLDANDNSFHDANEEFGLQGLLDPRFEIGAIRADGVNIVGTELSIVFERPNFDARFFRAANTEVTAATIEIDIQLVGSSGTGPGEIRTIEVTSAGQVAVQ